MVVIDVQITQTTFTESCLNVTPKKDLQKSEFCNAFKVH